MSCSDDRVFKSSEQTVLFEIFILHQVGQIRIEVQN